MVTADLVLLNCLLIYLFCLTVRQVIHALAECCPIVTPSYFDDIINSTNAGPAPLPVERYGYRDNFFFLHEL